MRLKRKPIQVNGMDNRRDWNAHQRGGWVTLWLWQGSKMSNKDIARLTGMTPQGAGKMMAILSAALPIVHIDGEWQWIEKDGK